MKGTYGGACNRTACQKPGAKFFNRSTLRYYCGECAEVLNRVNGADTLKLFGSPQLCVPIAPDEDRAQLETVLSMTRGKL